MGKLWQSKGLVFLKETKRCSKFFQTFGLSSESHWLVCVCMCVSLSVKYLLYAPLAAQVMYSLAYEEDYWRAFWCLNILIICGLKGLVHVLWSTYNNMLFLTRTLRINPKGVDFKQIDHEWNW